MSKPSVIVIFDSGVGGLSVFRHLRAQLPDRRLLYFADQENVPYGPKSKDEIVGLCHRVIRIIQKDFQIENFIVACNTATSAAIDILRVSYTFPIIGMEPAIRPALALANRKKVLSLGTEYTLRGDKFKALLSDLNATDQVLSVPMPGLVAFAEAAIFDGLEVEGYLEQQFENVDWQTIGAMVLGCTHFKYFHQSLKQWFDGAVLDGVDGTCRQVLRHVRPHSETAYENIYMISGQAQTDPFRPWINQLELSSP